MFRRDFIMLGGASVGVAVSGCMSQPQKVSFQQITQGHILRVNNMKGSDTNVSLKLIPQIKSGNSTSQTNTFRLSASDTRDISLPSESVANNYTVQISSDNFSNNNSIGLSETSKSVFTYNITESGINYTTREKPEIHLTIFNATDNTREFKISYTNLSSGGKFRQTETVNNDTINQYTDIFNHGSEYQISVDVNGMSDSTDFIYSSPDIVSITLSGEDLTVREGTR